jgi:hypothetical protein
VKDQEDLRTSNRQIVIIIEYRSDKREFSREEGFRGLKLIQIIVILHYFMFSARWETIRECSRRLKNMFSAVLTCFEFTFLEFFSLFLSNGHLCTIHQTGSLLTQICESHFSQKGL